jgi:hypothetical protein
MGVGAMKRILFSFLALLAGSACAAGNEALLPDTIGGPAGEVAFAKPENYPAHGLYEYIDGGADVYIEAGLKTCVVRQYRGLKNKSAEFEIAVFDMGSPICAFGLFRQLHDSLARGIGTESASEPRRISFWKSSLYVEVIDKSLNEVSDSAIASLAKNVAKALHGDTLLPPEIRLLPETGKIPGSEHYQKSGFLSRSFLNNALSAEYKRATGACTLFVMTCPSDSAAEAGLGVIGKEYGGDNQRVRAFASRNRVAGCVGCNAREFEQKWFGILIEQLRRGQ